MPFDFDLQHGEAVLLVEKRDALDQAGETLGGGRYWCWRLRLQTRIESKAFRMWKGDLRGQPGARLFVQVDFFRICLCGSAFRWCLGKILLLFQVGILVRHPVSHAGA